MKYLLMVVLLFSFNQAIAGQQESFYRGNSFYVGNELLENCEAYFSDATAANIRNGAICVGYIMGIVDIYSNLVVFKEVEQQGWCLPNDMSGTQLVRVVLKHLQEIPQFLHLSAAGLVANALYLAFPCE